MRIVSGISSHTETPKNLMENRRVFVRAKMRRYFVVFFATGTHVQLGLCSYKYLPNRWRPVVFYLEVGLFFRHTCITAANIGRPCSTDHKSLKGPILHLYALADVCRPMKASSFLLFIVLLQFLNVPDLVQDHRHAVGCCHFKFRNCQNHYLSPPTVITYLIWVIWVNIITAVIS